MFFQWNIDSPYVSDYFQHFLKNDLFDLYDLFFSIQGQSSHLGNVGNALLGQTLYLKQRKTIFMDKYKLQTYFSEIFIFFQNLKASPYHTKCVLDHGWYLLWTKLALSNIWKLKIYPSSDLNWLKLIFHIFTKF